MSVRMKSVSKVKSTSTESQSSCNASENDSPDYASVTVSDIE